VRAILETLESDFEKGASGIKLLPIFHGLLPDHAGWRPVYELCLRRRKPIILDCHGGTLANIQSTNESRERQELAKFLQNLWGLCKVAGPRLPAILECSFLAGALWDRACEGRLQGHLIV
jgi:hypothetical protein